MFSQNPSTQDRVPGSKVRRADTGGQTHADERGFGKSLRVNGEHVNLVSRNSIPPRADAAAKANGSPSSPRDFSVVRMEDGKENIAPPEVQVPKVRGGELHCCLRNRPSFPRDTSARVSRADAGYAAESSVVASVKSTLVSARRLPRASATPTPRPRACARARRRRPGWSPCRMRADGVALRPQRDAKRVATSAATNPV